MHSAISPTCIIMHVHLHVHLITQWTLSHAAGIFVRDVAGASKELYESISEHVSVIVYVFKRVISYTCICACLCYMQVYTCTQI